jgi:hypothetical protein
MTEEDRDCHIKKFFMDFYGFFYFFYGFFYFFLNAIVLQ